MTRGVSAGVERERNDIPYCIVRFYTLAPVQAVLEECGDIPTSHHTHRCRHHLVSPPKAFRLSLTFLYLCSSRRLNLLAVLLHPFDALDTISVTKLVRFSICPCWAVSRISTKVMVSNELKTNPGRMKGTTARNLCNLYILLHSFALAANSKQ